MNTLAQCNHAPPESDPNHPAAERPAAQSSGNSTGPPYPGGTTDQQLAPRKAPPAVRVIVGDLMYANEADKARIIAKFQSAHPDLADDFEDEFFWNVAAAELMLHRCESATQRTQFSDFSWVCELNMGKR